MPFLSCGGFRVWRLCFKRSGGLPAGKSKQTLPKLWCRASHPSGLAGPEHSGNILRTLQASLFGSAGARQFAPQDAFGQRRSSNLKTEKIDSESLSKLADLLAAAFNGRFEIAASVKQC